MRASCCGRERPPSGPGLRSRLVRLRRLRMGLATVLGIAPRGFFIPYARAELGAAERRRHARIEAAFAALGEDFAAFVDLLDRYRADLLAIAAEAAPPAPRWGQDWFPGLDRRGPVRAGSPPPAAPDRRDRLRPLDAVPRAGRRRRRVRVRDHGHRPGPARGPRRPAAAAAAPPRAGGRPGGVRGDGGGRHADRRFQPCADAGQRRRRHPQRHPARLGRGRPGAGPRRLPARPLPGRVALARLQRAGRAGAAGRHRRAPTGPCSPAAMRAARWASGWRARWSPSCRAPPARSNPASG